jgi:hypothetical protein
VERIVQKGAYDRDALLREVVRLLAATIARDPDREGADTA